MPPDKPEVRLLRRWIDCWCGVGNVVRGTTLRRWNVQLTEYAAAY